MTLQEWKELVIDNAYILSQAIFKAIAESAWNARVNPTQGVNPNTYEGKAFEF
jgi:hypothetical protein